MCFLRRFLTLSRALAQFMRRLQTKQTIWILAFRQRSLKCRPTAIQSRCMRCYYCTLQLQPTCLPNETHFLCMESHTVRLRCGAEARWPLRKIRTTANDGARLAVAFARLPRSSLPVCFSQLVESHDIMSFFGIPTKLLPAEAGRLKDFVSYGLKSFAHDGVI